MRLPLCALLLAACVGDKPQESGESPSLDDSDAPCGESGICALETRDALVTCGDSNGGLVANSSAPGELDVLHDAASQGCCPTFLLSAEASQRRAEITVTYDLSQDPCDCICALDLSYTLSGIPSGIWTLVTPNGSIPVDVQ